MNELSGATTADVVVAVLVVLNSALIAYGNWQRTRQNARIVKKVEEVHQDMTNQHNGD